MHLRTDVSDVFLYLPNAFSAASFTAEQRNVASIALRIIGTYQAEEGRLSGSVLTAQRPFLATLHRPVEFFQDSTLAIADAYLIQIDNMLCMIKVI